MSLMGKIVVINNLMLSQTIYKILSLNTPNDEIIAKIKKLITDFLWDGKKPQIAYETLIKNYTDGGLRLVDFRRKDQALKMSWIIKSKTANNIWVKIASKLLPIQLPEIFECNIAHKDLKYLVLDDNWIITSVLKAWSKTCFSTPRSKEEILDQPLWLNSHIRKGNQLLNNEKMRKRGIFFVRDIFDEKNGVALPFEDINRSYGNVGNFIEYLACTQQIPPNWKKRLKITTCSQGLPQGHAEIARGIITSPGKISKRMYEHIVQATTNNYNHGRNVWQVELKMTWDKNEWQKIRVHALKIVTAVFQFKPLSKKLVTNVNRNRWNNEISPKCYYCQKEKETTIHLIWECQKVNSFWQGVIKWIEYVLRIKCKWNLCTIIINKTQGKNKLFEDTVILLAKQYIYATKC